MRIKPLLLTLGICLFAIIWRGVARSFGWYGFEFFTLAGVVIWLFSFPKQMILVLPLAVAVSDILIGNNHSIVLFTWGAWALIALLYAHSAPLVRPPRQSGSDLIWIGLLVILSQVLPRAFLLNGQIASEFTLGVYAVLIVLIGVGWKKRTSSRIFGMGLISCGVFYLVSNFGVMWEGWLYPRTLPGLLDSYIMALPFLERHVQGNFLVLGMLAAGVVLWGMASWKDQVQKINTIQHIPGEI